MHSLKRGKVLSREATYIDYIQTVKNNSVGEQRRQAIENGAVRIRREEEDFVVRVSSGFTQNINSFS